MLSVFTIVCWDQMKENSFKRCFLIYLRPLNSVPKSKVGKSPAHANRLGEYICRHSVKSQRCSKTHHLYSCLQNIVSSKCMLLLLCHYQIFIGSQFEKQGVNLTNGV